MKNSISSTIGILTLLAVGAESAQAAHSTQPVANIEAGVYYDLTPQRAKALNINLLKLQEEMNITESKKILFKIQEDGELDLSVYDNPVFASTRADGVIR